MNKRNKRLLLRRESVRRLTKQQMHRAIGAGDDLSNWSLVFSNSTLESGPQADSTLNPTGLLDRRCTTWSNDSFGDGINKL